MWSAAHFISTMKGPDKIIKGPKGKKVTTEKAPWFSWNHLELFMDCTLLMAWCIIMLVISILGCINWLDPAIQMYLQWVSRVSAWSRKPSRKLHGLRFLGQIPILASGNLLKASSVHWSSPDVPVFAEIIIGTLDEALDTANEKGCSCPSDSLSIHLFTFSLKNSAEMGQQISVISVFVFQIPSLEADVSIRVRFGHT